MFHDCDPASVPNVNVRVDVSEVPAAPASKYTKNINKLAKCDPVTHS